MSQGRSSAAGTAVLIAVAMLCLVARFEYVEAATYTVGGPGGWTFNVASWVKGKTFRAGDTLVFNYDPALHNVVSVDKAGYISCRIPPGARVVRSGKDQFKLAKGRNFFICNVPGHCEGGMKIAITAL